MRWLIFFALYSLVQGQNTDKLMDVISEFGKRCGPPIPEHLKPSYQSAGKPSLTQIYIEKREEFYCDLEKKRELIVVRVAKEETFNSYERLPALPKGTTYQITKFNGLPIYHVLTDNELTQSLLTERMAVFVESPHRKVLKDSEMNTWLSKNKAQGSCGGGYNFRLSDVAKFYNSAHAKNIALNPLEFQLKENLLSLALLKAKEGGGVEAPHDAALIGTATCARKSDFDHELNHGIYFTDPDYRQASQQLYKSLSASEKLIVLKFLKGLSTFEHDLSNKDLITREFIAHFRDIPEAKFLIRNHSMKFFAEELSVVDQLGARVGAIDCTSKVYCPRSLAPHTQGIE